MKETLEATRNIHQILIVVCTIIGAFAISLKPSYIVYEDALDELNVIYGGLDTVCACRKNALQASLDSLKPMMESKYKLKVTNTFVNTGLWPWLRPEFNPVTGTKLGEVLADLKSRLEPRVKNFTPLKSIKGNARQLTYSPEGFGAYGKEKVDRRHVIRNLNSLIISASPLKELDALLDGLTPAQISRLNSEKIELGYQLSSTGGTAYVDYATLTLLINGEKMIMTERSVRRVIDDMIYYNFYNYKNCTYLPLYSNYKLWDVSIHENHPLGRLYLKVPNDVDENAFLPNLKAVWSIVENLPYIEAKNTLTKLSRNKEVTGSVDVSGLKVATELIYIIGPFVILALTLYLLTLVIHLNSVYKTDLTLLKTFPWLGLFPNFLARLMIIITIIGFPLAVSVLAVWKSSITVNEKWMFTAVYAPIFGFTSGIIIRRIIRLQNHVYRNIEPLHSQPDEQTGADSSPSN